jgi:hypothetical protein
MNPVAFLFIVLLNGIKEHKLRKEYLLSINFKDGIKHPGKQIKRNNLTIHGTYRTASAY